MARRTLLVALVLFAVACGQNLDAAMSGEWHWVQMMRTVTLEDGRILSDGDVIGEYTVIGDRTIRVVVPARENTTGLNITVTVALPNEREMTWGVQQDPNFYTFTRPEP